MITRRGIFAALFGGVAAPVILSPPLPNPAPTNANASVYLEWDYQARRWKVESQWVMTTDGKDVVYRRYDELGKETHVRRYQDIRWQKRQSYRVEKAEWPKES